MFHFHIYHCARLLADGETLGSIDASTRLRHMANPKDGGLPSHGRHQDPIGAIAHDRANFGGVASVSTGIPEISPSLRKWTENVASDHGSVVNRVYMALMNIGTYADLDSATKLDLRDSIALSTRLWLDTLLSGRAPSEENLEAFRGYGRRRVHQGVPLATILQAFRQGSRELWCFYIEVEEQNPNLRDELLFQISPFLMEFFDVHAQIISQTYLDEQYMQVRWRESLRHQLHSIIFNFPEDVEGFKKAATALRIDGTIPRIALAFDLDVIDSNSPTFKGDLDRIVAATARCLRVSVDDLVDSWYRGQLLIWVPARLGDLMSANDRQVARQVSSMADTLPEVKAIGVGLMAEGVAGWAMSADEAGRALSFGRSRSGEERVRLYSEIVVEESIRGSRNALRYLVSLIEQLASEPDLLETLKVYFEQLQRRKVTAGILGIHPNTLNYRLDRIENMLGAQLDNAAWVTKLDVALKLRGTLR